MNRFFNWSHQVTAQWFGNTNCTNFVLKVNFHHRIPMIINDYKINKYNEIEFYGKFVPEKETNQYNRNGSITTPTETPSGNKGLRDVE